jgi:hypothetical protein
MPSSVSSSIHPAVGSALRRAPLSALNWELPRLLDNRCRTMGDRLKSTDGPVEHVRVTCVNRHWFFMPADTFTERAESTSTLITAGPSTWGQPSSPRQISLDQQNHRCSAHDPAPRVMRLCADLRNGAKRLLSGSRVDGTVTGQHVAVRPAAAGTDLSPIPRSTHGPSRATISTTQSGLAREVITEWHC